MGIYEVWCVHDIPAGEIHLVRRLLYSFREYLPARSAASPGYMCVSEMTTLSLGFRRRLFKASARFIVT